MVEINDFLKTFTAAYGVDEKEFKSNSRVRDLVDLRSVYCTVARDLGEYSLDVIGKTLNRHHASVIHAVKNYRILSQIDKDLKTKYNNACIIYNALKQPKDGKTVGLIDALLKSNNMLRYKLSKNKSDLDKLKIKYKQLKKQINTLTELI
jgi:hypothetical protein